MSKNKIYYKGVRVNLLGLPILSKPKKYKNLESDERVRGFYNISFKNSFPDNAQKNLLLIYDIPEGRKKERDWFRRQLKNFGFVMIQRSVWVGPSPLPIDFLAYLKRIGLQKEFKTFKLAKSYNS